MAYARRIKPGARGDRGGLATANPMVGVADLFLGALLIPERTMVLPHGWWAKRQWPLPCVFDVVTTTDLRTGTSTVRASRGDWCEWRAYFVDEISGRGDERYSHIAEKRAIMIDANMAAISRRLDEMTGYPDLRSHAEAMDAIRMAPDAWSRAIFALDRAAPRMFLGWGS